MTRAKALMTAVMTSGLAGLMLGTLGLLMIDDPKVLALYGVALAAFGLWIGRETYAACVAPELRGRTASEG